jgi:hypothetical protein
VYSQLRNYASFSDWPATPQIKKNWRYGWSKRPKNIFLSSIFLSDESFQAMIPSCWLNGAKQTEK